MEGYCYIPAKNGSIQQPIDALRRVGWNVDDESLMFNPLPVTAWKTSNMDSWKGARQIALDSATTDS